MSSHPGHLLDIRNLDLSVGEFSLSNISFSLSANDYLVLLGPTGSGKTILLNAITGVRKLSSGNIFLDGSDISTMPVYKRKIGFVSQHNDLFPHLNVMENVLFGLKYSGLSSREVMERTEKYMSLFGVSELASRDVRTLSGGEAKKVMMARTLAVQPRLVLMDEPLSMLDHNARLSMLSKLREIHQSLNLTIIHVSHDRSEAWAIGRKCAVISDGKIEQFGSTTELFRKSRNLFVAGFLGGINIFPAKFAEDNGVAYAVSSAWKFRLPSRPEFESGFVQLRPEGLSLGGTGGQFTVSGMISAISDAGEFCEIRIRNLDGNPEELLIHESHSAASGIVINQKITASFSPEFIHCFKR